MAAAIILAHKRPDLLGSLLDHCRPFDVALHIDRKSPEAEKMLAAALAKRPDVELLPREECYWGGFGIIRAALAGLRWFLDTGQTHVVLLSGQCAVVGSPAAAAARIDGLGRMSMIRCRALPISDWNGHGGFDRVTRVFVQSSLSGRPVKVPIVRRQPPRGLDLYGGSAFWTMTREAASYVLEFVERDRSFVRQMSTALIPDEMFFQTILMNSPLRESIASESPHAIFWKNGASHPNTIAMDDIPAVRASGKMFTRKIEDVAVAEALSGSRE